MQSVYEYSPGDVLLPEEEPVAIRNDQRDFISDEIKQQLAIAIDVTFKPHGWKKAAFLLRELGPIAATIAIVVALLGITLSAVYYSVANVREETRFRATTEKRLDGIEKSLDGIKGELAKQALINHASLPLPDFKATLPDLSSALATAQQQKVKAPLKVIGDLQQKLIASGEDDPGFWPTAAEFISYRSAVKNGDFKTSVVPSLPQCADHAPTPMEAVDTSKETGKPRIEITAVRLKVEQNQLVEGTG